MPDIIYIMCEFEYFTFQPTAINKCSVGVLIASFTDMNMEMKNMDMN